MKIEENKMHSYLCEQLTYLKQDHFEFYEDVLSVLEFIYKVVDKEELTRLKEKHELVNRFEKITSSIYIHNHKVQEVERRRSELFNGFINAENGVIFCLFEMCNDKDKRFAEKFFASVTVPITMFKRGISCNTSPTSYVYNLYAMLIGYHANKDNYENYSVIVDDIKNEFILDDVYYDKKEWDFSNKRNIISSLVQNKNYYKSIPLREMLKKTISQMPKHYSDQQIYQYNHMFKKYFELFEQVVVLRNNGYDIVDEIIKEIETDLSQLTEYLPDSNNPPEVYYECILLLNNRYQFIKERLPKLDKNQQFKNQVVGHIANMSYEFFAYLNSLEIYEEDSFIAAMKIVFNSDSFEAVFKRLAAMEEASRAYLDGNKEKSLQVMKELSSFIHDIQSDGSKLVLPSDNINLIKPDSISERMIMFYQLYRGLSNNPQCLADYHENKYKNKQLVEFMNALEEETQSRVALQKGISTLEKAPKTKKGLFSYFS